jgi:hypothetical protein
MMEYQLELYHDLYIIIFDYLDWYSKYEYVKYLHENHYIYYHKYISVPTDSDFIETCTYGSDATKVLLNYVNTCYQNPFQHIEHWALLYVENFICAKVWCEAMAKRFEGNGIDIHRLCIRNYNYELLKSIHDYRGDHYKKLIHTHENKNISALVNGISRSVELYGYYFDCFLV